MDPDYNPTCIQEQASIQKFNQQCEQIKTVIASWNPSSFKDKQLYHGSGSRLQSYLHSGTKLDSEVPPAVSKSKQ
jgi:hypothetical protein